MAIPTCITFFLHATRHNNATSGVYGSSQGKPAPEVPDQPARRMHHTAGVGGMQPRGEACMLVQLRGGEVYVQIWLGIYCMPGGSRDARVTVAFATGTGCGLPNPDLCQWG